VELAAVGRNDEDVIGAVVVARLVLFRREHDESPIR